MSGPPPAGGERRASSATAPKVFYRAALVLALGVGAFQMFRVRGGWVTSYGADVFGTAWLYGMFRQGKTLFRHGRALAPGTAAAIVLSGCSLSEFGQRWNVVPGVFDAADLGFFAATVLACYVVDRWIVSLG